MLMTTVHPQDTKSTLSNKYKYNDNKKIFEDRIKNWNKVAHAMSSLKSQ
jgi:hypothetical protein